MLYPFIHPQYNKYQEAENFCQTVMQLLLNFVPDSDKTKAAEKLSKYLYYDDAQPLANKLPTMTQLKQLIYDTSKPNDPPDPKKGYRVFIQRKIIEAQTQAKIEMRINPAIIIPSNDFLGVFFFTIEFWVHMGNQQVNSFASRPLNMALAAMETLIGRHIDGVGTVFFNNHYDGGRGYCKLDDNLGDARFNNGMALTLGVHMGSGEVDYDSFRN